MLLISIIDTATLKKFITPLFIISFIFLALVPFIGVEVKGAKRWLDFYLFRLQPIELLKPFFILITVKIFNSEEFGKFRGKIFFQFFAIIFCNNSSYRST